MAARSIDNNVRTSDKNLVVNRAPSLAAVASAAVASGSGVEGQEGNTMSQCKNTFSTFHFALSIYIYVHMYIYIYI